MKPVNIYVANLQRQKLPIQQRDSLRAGVARKIGASGGNYVVLDRRLCM